MTRVSINEGEFVVKLSTENSKVIEKRIWRQYSWDVIVNCCKFVTKLDFSGVNSLSSNLVESNWFLLNTKMPQLCPAFALSHSLSRAKSVWDGLGLTLFSWTYDNLITIGYWFSSFGLKTSFSSRTKTRRRNHIFNYNSIKFIHTYWTKSHLTRKLTIN